MPKLERQRSSGRRCWLLVAYIYLLVIHTITKNSTSMLQNRIEIKSLLNCHKPYETTEANFHNLISLSSLKSTK